jgi:D-tyrosyl-tRNA(Tyr) deacylase
LRGQQKGNRPSFAGAAPPAHAEALYGAFCEALRAEGLAVETGRFGARMVVEVANDGPVTIVLERRPQRLRVETGICFESDHQGRREKTR